MKNQYSWGRYPWEIVTSLCGKVLMVDFFMAGQLTSQEEHAMQTRPQRYKRVKDSLRLHVDDHLLLRITGVKETLISRHRGSRRSWR